jgi:hypothetical protein
MPLIVYALALKFYYYILSRLSRLKKQELSAVKQKKKSSKKFMSLVVTMAVKSPGVRLILSPKHRSPIAAIRTSPTQTVPHNSNNKRPNSNGKCNMPLFQQYDSMQIL